MLVRVPVSHNPMAMRRGFTLIELLVASGVFLFGFTAALGLLLIGTRARSQADGMLRLSLAASSIVEEIRLEAGREPDSLPSDLTPPPYMPSAYVGDGFAAIPSSGDGPATGDPVFYPYRPQPGVWYRVLGCVDEKGDPGDALATALRVDLLVIWNPVADETLLFSDLSTRQRFDKQTGWPGSSANIDTQLTFAADFMAKRGFAVRETAWIIRKPSWER